MTCNLTCVTSRHQPADRHDGAWPLPKGADPPAEPRRLPVHRVQHFLLLPGQETSLDTWPPNLTPLLPLRNQLKIRKNSVKLLRKILNSRYTHASSLAVYFTVVVVSCALRVASQKASSVKNNPGLAVPSISIQWIFGSITLQKKLYNVVRNNTTLIQLKAKTVANVA
jgi:hypothetical protein